MALMLLSQARAAHWKYDAFQDYLIIFNINFPPCKFRALVVDGEKKKPPECPLPERVVNGASWCSAKPGKLEGMEGRLLHKTSRRIHEASVLGSQRVTVSSTGEEKIA